MEFHGVSSQIAIDYNIWAMYDKSLIWMFRPFWIPLQSLPFGVTNWRERSRNCPDNIILKRKKGPSSDPHVFGSKLPTKKWWPNLGCQTHGEAIYGCTVSSHKGPANPQLCSKSYKKWGLVATCMFKNTCFNHFVCLCHLPTGFFYGSSLNSTKSKLDKDWILGTLLTPRGLLRNFKVPKWGELQKHRDMAFSTVDGSAI